ncbi:hypothetical protein BJF78_32180 [Pseudonocardia sp. CNS-139]|nr:hypothetical protein BJF78_32180 [Pseudonocardia sp. CNS-139]
MAAAAFGPVAAVASATDGTVAGVPVRVYVPVAEGPLPVVVHFHGGGYVFGDLDTHDGVARELAARTPAVVVAVDYRLAPEHPFPAAVADSWAVVAHVREHAAGWGGDPDRVAVGGDSAGGGLAAVAALRARDAGLPLRLQFLVYPVADHNPERASMREYSKGYGLTASAMDWYVEQYLPAAADRSSPEAFPLLADSLAGVAEAHVVTVEFDPVRDSGEAYAQRLRDAGVRVTQIREPGLVHGSYRMPGLIPEARRILDGVVTALRRTLHDERPA